ncbi:hypothetical protein FRC17_007901 [Serendipita sp. 399]|nr:hypothetical protein FRC17_007901 [Serendipita sp. 399]
MGANRALRAFFAPLVFQTLHVFRQSSQNYWYRSLKTQRDLTVSTVAHFIQRVRVTRNASSLEPDAIASLTIILPTLVNLRSLTIAVGAPFKEELYLEIRRHPSLKELKISDKANGPMWKPFVLNKEPPTCRLVYLEAPKVVVEDLLCKGSPSTETIQSLAVVGQPMLRLVHQLGPFPSLHRLILVEKSTGTLHLTFWKFLHEHPDLKELVITFAEDVDNFRDKTDLKNAVEFRNNLRSISGPYFLIEPLISASQGSLESVVISDVSYRGNLRDTLNQVPIEQHLRKVLRASIQLTHIQHLSVILYSARYDCITKEIEELARSSTLRSLRSFGLALRSNNEEEAFESIMDKICSSLIGNLPSECSIKLSVTCKEVHKRKDLFMFTDEDIGQILRSGYGPSTCFNEVCPTVMKWAAIPAFGLVQVEIWWNSHRWFTFKRKIPEVEWLAILTPNGGKITPDIPMDVLRDRLHSLPRFKNAVSVWVGKENTFPRTEFYPP